MRCTHFLLCGVLSESSDRLHQEQDCENCLVADSWRCMLVTGQLVCLKVFCPDNCFIPAILTERIKTDAGSPEDEKEIEELKGLLPEIKEKIEDSKESQKSAKVAELGLKATLVSVSYGFLLTQLFFQWNLA